MNKKFLLPIALALIVGSATPYLAGTGSDHSESTGVTGHGDVETLKRIYGRWIARYEAGGGDRILTIPLAYSKALSGEFSPARGRMRLDLLEGSLTVEVRGLDAGDYAVWLVDNKTGWPRAAAGDKANNQLNLGRLERGADGKWVLENRLDGLGMSGFTLDLVAVAREGQAPEQGGVLFGTPDFMQRLYYGDKPWTVTRVGNLPEVQQANAVKPFEFLLPRIAHARVSGIGQALANKANKNKKNNKESDLDVVLGALIARGQDIFVNETFRGNGRTCATCHRPDNNHTIDPKYILKLPKKDPLFVAEYNPALRDLEKPQLLRQFGLVLANVDGFDRPGVMRGVPHTLALATSIGTELLEDGGEFEEDALFANAIGWSGDGAPGDGSLRLFTQGAIAQHMTRRLNRVTGVDFRLATDEELDALEAYMLSLGRSEDIVLADLTFTSPLVERGKQLFDTKENPVDASGKPIFGQTANCNGCHQNAGANSSTTTKNPTRDTGVENMRDQPARLVDASVPYDGGFGKEEHHARTDCGPDYDQPCYGDGRFNTPSLIEAADTAPFFHNNSVSTIEEAVAYYTTDAFNLSPGALTSSGKNRQIKLDSSQIVAVAMFLRTLNALENIRSSNQLDQQALAMQDRNATEVIRLAAADTKDAIEVLTEGVLIVYPEAVDYLRQALKLERKAASRRAWGQRKELVARAIEFKKKARASMVIGPEERLSTASAGGGPVAPLGSGIDKARARVLGSLLHR
jgi:mono/diheme cytochrome c family protein